MQRLILLLLSSIGLLLLPLVGEAESPADRARFDSGFQETPRGPVADGPTPWTHLRFKNDPEDFQFAIVTDRTGSPRQGIWEEAMVKLNWLQPEFVMSVGDLIRGTTENAETNAAEWDAMEGWIAGLEMPFFHVAGNHDIQAKAVPGRVSYEVMRGQWEERFGAPYYYFRYRDVLFITLFSNDGQDQVLSPEQVAYFEDILSEHTEVRWTLVFLHHPLWVYPHETGFNRIEKALKGRNYTVFAGHTHNYVHLPRKKMDYYILATTGGGSRMLGNSFGQFDHVVWVTMTDDGPILANLRLDGILPHDVATYESAMLGDALYRSTKVEQEIYLGGENPVTGGVAYLTYTNESDRPLHLEARFFHNHHVNPNPGEISATIPPRTDHTIPIALEVIHPFAQADGILLELEGTLSPRHPDYPDLAISGIETLLVANSEFQATPLESGVFTGTTVLTFDPAPGNTQVRYTLDGSNPTDRSPLFDGPIPIRESTTVRSRLFTPEGFSSGPHTVTLEKIQPGPGLLCHLYENDPEVERWGTLPDFSAHTPVLIHPATTFDLDALARRADHFGLRFTGRIQIPEAGDYVFTVLSDDGVEVRIDGKPIITDKVKHPPRKASSGPLALEAKAYPFQLDYFQDKRTRALDVFYSLNDGPRKPVPFEWFHFE